MVLQIGPDPCDECYQDPTLPMRTPPEEQKALLFEGRSGEFSYLGIGFMLDTTLIILTLELRSMKSHPLSTYSLCSERCQELTPTKSLWKENRKLLKSKLILLTGIIV